MKNVIYSIFIITAVSVSFVSCNQVNTETEIPPQALLDPMDMVDTNTGTSTNLISVNDFLSAPFTVMGSGNESDVWQEKDAIYGEDTLRSINYKASLFHVLNHEHIDATIYDKQLSLIRDIHIGITRSEFNEKFIGLKQHENNPFIFTDEHKVILRQGADADMYDQWEFVFYNDTLELIKFDHYIDTDLEFPVFEMEEEVL